MEAQREGGRAKERDMVLFWVRLLISAEGTKVFADVVINALATSLHALLLPLFF